MDLLAEANQAKAHINVRTVECSGLSNDPKRPDEPESIVRTLGQVISVGLETVRTVKGLPEVKIE